MTKKEHFRSHLALCLEMNPTLSISSFFAYRFEELLILLVCDILLLSRPDGHVVVQCVPRPHIHLTNVTREREREREESEQRIRSQVLHRKIKSQQRIKQSH